MAGRLRRTPLSLVDQLQQIADESGTQTKILHSQAVRDVRAGRITTGTIAAATVTLDSGGDVSYIQSDNFVTGTSGWQIDGDGNAEFNNVTVRGTIYATSGEIGDLSIVNWLTLTGSGGIRTASPGTERVELTTDEWLDFRNSSNTLVGRFGYYHDGTHDSVRFQSRNDATIHINTNGENGIILIEAGNWLTLRSEKMLNISAGYDSTGYTLTLGVGVSGTGAHGILELDEDYGTRSTRYGIYIDHMLLSGSDTRSMTVEKEDADAAYIFWKATATAQDWGYLGFNAADNFIISTLDSADQDLLFYTYYSGSVRERIRITGDDDITVRDRGGTLILSWDEGEDRFAFAKNIAVDSPTANDSGYTARLRSVSSRYELERHTSSTRRVKKNIRPLEGSFVEVFDKVPVITYEFKKTAKEMPQDGLTRAGMLAEVMNEVWPNAVILDDSGEPEGINYDQLTIPLWGGMREAYERIRQLEERVAELERAA